jgi:phage FluMu gp28-like protein
MSLPNYTTAFPWDLDEKLSILDSQCSMTPAPSDSHSAGGEGRGEVASPTLAFSIQPLAFPLPLRPYQQSAFTSTAGIELWLWARQTGKSHTLAAWAIHRLLTRPGRLVTILSNSKANGIHLNQKIAQLCDQLQRRWDVSRCDTSAPRGAALPEPTSTFTYEQIDLSPKSNFTFESFNTETRITLGAASSASPVQKSALCNPQSAFPPGRIKILAANPRTARGFSGDLILDEFAFHENAQSIWEAAEPILAANPDYQCRIASTPNGKHNYFYELCTAGQIPVRKLTRTDAWQQGCEIFHPITRASITPTEARALAPNKPAYDQNYECSFNDTNFSLLTHELISSAEHPNLCPITEQEWSPTLFLPNEKWKIVNEQCSMTEPFPNNKFSILDSQCPMNLYAGIDVARHHDLTVITLLSADFPSFPLSATSALSCKTSSFTIRAILRLRDTRLPDQQLRLNQILSLPNLIHAKLDMTGLGLGLLEYTQQKFPTKITGINFASTISLPTQSSVLSPRHFSLPLSARSATSCKTSSSVRVTEYLATQLLQTFEDRRIHIPIDAILRDDLRKPQRIVSASGQVQIAATRDSAGHADHFWSLALALEAAKNTPPAPYHHTTVHLRNNRGAKAPRKHRFNR